MIRNQGVSSFPELEIFLKNNEQEIKAVKRSLKNIEGLYNISIPIEELAYVSNIVINY